MLKKGGVYARTELFFLQKRRPEIEQTFFPLTSKCWKQKKKIKNGKRKSHHQVLLFRNIFHFSMFISCYFVFFSPSRQIFLK